MAETVVGHREPRLLDGGGEYRASNSPGMIARFAALLRAPRRAYVVLSDKTANRLEVTERQMSPCAAKPTRVVVARSSGNAVLDNAAADAVSRMQCGPLGRTVAFIQPIAFGLTQ